MCKCTVDVACIEDWYEHQSIARITHAIEEKENKVFSNEYVTISVNEYSLEMMFWVLN